MNPLQQNQGGRPQQPQGQQNQLENDGQENSREVQIREDRTVVTDTIDTFYTPKQTVKRYNKIAEQYKNLQKGVEAYSDKISETLDEYDAELGILHIMVDNHPQDNPDAVPEPEEAVDMLSSQDLQRYHSIQEMNEQKDDFKDKIEDSLSDAEDLYPAARKMADKHDLTLEPSPDELRGWNPEDDEEPVDEE